MTDLNIRDYVPVGKIVKPHGIRGEVVIETGERFEEHFEEAEYLLLKVEGGLVPFFLSDAGLHFRTPGTMVASFEDLDSAEKIRPYCGCPIYLPKDATQESDLSEEIQKLIGFTVFDTTKGRLGKIIRIDDFSGNVVLTIAHAGKEVMVPFQEELIAGFDEQEETLHFNIPEGLIELYL